MIYRSHKPKRRRSVGRRALAATSAVMLPALTATGAATAQSYKIIDLGPGVGTFNVWSARAINDTGQVTGDGYSGDWTTLERAFFWQDGGVTNLGAFPDECQSGEMQSFAFDINESNQIAGYSANHAGCGLHHAILWLMTPGFGLPAGLNDLGVIGGALSISEAFGINNAGQVVGVSTISDGGSEHAFLWLPEPTYGLPAGMNDIGALTDDCGAPNRCAIAYATNNHGQVAGASRAAPYPAPDSFYRAFLWLPSAAYDLPAGMNELGSLGSSTTEARDLNDSGQVVGYSVTVWPNWHAFLWLPSPAYGLPAGTNDLGKLGGLRAEANAINDLGHVVGRTDTDEIGGCANCFASHAFFWENGVMTDLNDLLPEGSGWELQGAWGNNNDGQIVGWGRLDGASHAFLMTPEALGLAIPTVSSWGLVTLTLLTITAGTLVLSRRRIGATC